jgi:predicted Fe-S protein YdhL (DUF1289 family)
MTFRQSPASSGTSELGPPSPCIRQCTLDAADECVGCGRTIDEILAWAVSPVSRQIEISEAAAARREQRRLRRFAPPESAGEPIA